MSRIPLSPAVARLAEFNTHPGLELDKFPRSLGYDQREGYSQAVQRPTLIRVAERSSSAPDGWTLWRASRESLLKAVGATRIDATTAGPLTLHLSRASALENAGMCLHRVYEFAYLPGSGLKGLAHAYACEVWLGAQPDRAAAWEAISEVFGVAPSPWLRDLAERHGVTAPKLSKAGSVVFHDAWPAEWPKLIVDIVNNHHPEYYQADPRRVPPPGDWESPNPVYFLAVPPGTRFTFALHPRRAEDRALAETARRWLIGGLTELGAGAKTNAGYGAFDVPGEPTAPPPPSAKRAVADFALELVTPAFLAGAGQAEADCDLRGATLRGQLRWWWRTLHAGFVGPAELRAMEATVWGDTKVGGAVRLAVRATGAIKALKFDRPQFIRDQRLPPTPDRKTSQGLIYHSYGMDEIKEGVRVTRYFAAPGAKWSVALRARPSRPANGGEILADVVLAQASAALGLLARFGGVGAKGRKGFGSFADLPGFDLAAAKRAAADFRAAFGFGRPPFDPKRAESPALEHALFLPDVASGGSNYWLVLDQLAAAAQQFAKGLKHDLGKKALGLPRRIGAPVKGTFRPGGRVAKTDRHASPALFHVGKAAGGGLCVRAVAFPASELPDLAASTDMLRRLFAGLASSLPANFAQHVAGKPLGAAPLPAARPADPAVAPGQRVRARVVADPKSKNRLFAEFRGLTGNVLNAPATVPAVGAEVELIVNSVNAAQRQIAFRWPT